jgi:hypothetical protein
MTNGDTRVPVLMAGDHAWSDMLARKRRRAGGSSGHLTQSPPPSSYSSGQRLTPQVVLRIDSAEMVG